MTFLLLPAFLLGPGRCDLAVVPEDTGLAAIDEKVSGGFDHAEIHGRQLGVGDAAGLPELPSKHDGHGCLVQLDPDPLNLPVDMGLLQEPAGRAGVARRVGADLDLGQVAEGGDRRLDVTEGHQGHGDLIEVARPDGFVAGR